MTVWPSRLMSFNMLEYPLLLDSWILRCYSVQRFKFQIDGACDKEKEALERCAADAVRIVRLARPYLPVTQASWAPSSAMSMIACLQHFVDDVVSDCSFSSGPLHVPVTQ